MGSSARARHLFFLAALVAVAAPRSADAWGGGRFFFSKTTRAEATAEPEKKAAGGDTVAAPAFSRPSTAGSGGRGYGLYGRPEEKYPADYFRRGVHRNTEKLTTTTGGERVRTTFPEDGGRGRPPTDVPGATEEEGGGAGGDLEGVRPYPENGSGRGRPPWYYTAFHRGRQQEQEQRDFGMSDTRLYQNGRYYYDVDAGRYGYGRESNPMRTSPDEWEFGSGRYGRPRGPAGGRRGSSYADAAGYQQRYGNDEEFGDGAMDQNTNAAFQEEAGQNGRRYTP